jgi:DDE family transposase
MTDPDVRVMRNKKDYVSAYNSQLVVTEQQVIVGAMLSQHPVDRTLLRPLLDTYRLQLAEAGIRPRLRTVLADAGYASEDNFIRGEQQTLRLLVPLRKDPNLHPTQPPRQRATTTLPATVRASRRMRHPRGKADYKLRGQTVEPVVGQIKRCQRLTMMSRRGIAACSSEWLLIATAHNLRKLHVDRHSRDGRPPASARIETATTQVRRRRGP